MKPTRQKQRCSALSCGCDHHKMVLGHTAEFGSVLLQETVTFTKKVYEYKF